jgi:phosphohistidine phosphatase
MEFNSNHKRLILLRHSDAEAIGNKKDFDRDLTTEGKKKVVQTGQMLRELYSFDQVWYSSSRRTQQTMETLQLSSKNTFATDALYLVEADEILKLVGEFSNQYQEILIIGHNNGLSEFASFLTNEDILLSPCEFIEIELNLNDWKLTSRGIGTIKRNILVP